MKIQGNHTTRLTKSYIDKLPLSEERYEVTDNKLSGFKIRVGKTKKVFIIRYRFGNTRPTFSIGDYGTWTPELARKEAQRLLREVDRGVNPAEQKNAIRHAMTFKELADEYIANSMKTSLKGDIGKLNGFLLPKWATKHVNTITSKDVRSTLRALRDKGRTPATYNRYLTLIKTIFNRAVEWKLLTENPASCIKPLEENNWRERFLSEDEVHRLLAALENVPNNAANAIKLALFTGQRFGNIKAAKWCEISGTLWRIPKTKSGRSHKVPLTTEALMVLEKQHAINCNSEYVFPGKHGKPHLTSVQTMWEKVRKEANLPDVRLHDLRHTYASWAINSGATLYDVQKLLGHSDSKMTQRYAHLADERQHEVAANATAGMVIDFAERRRRISA